MKIENIKTPLIAIPTTAGTGAEATQFAVLYINKNKYSIAHHSILPNTVFLSSDFSHSANSYLTACTGLDAFCQAVESVWSVNSNTESEKYALEAIELIWGNLQKAVKEKPLALSKIIQVAQLLQGVLKDETSEDEMVKLRLSYLQAQLSSLSARASMLVGDVDYDFDQQSKALYDTQAPHYELKEFEKTFYS